MKTLEYLVDNQYQYYLAETNTSDTLKTRLRRLKKPLAAVKHLSPREASPALVRESFLDWADGKSPKTAKSGITELRAFWKWMAEEGHVDKNPWSGDTPAKELTRLPRLFKGKPNAVKPTHNDEEAALLYGLLKAGAQHDPREVEMVALLGLVMGFRVGEVLDLTPAAIRGQKIVVVDGKTGDREQTMPADVRDLVHRAATGLSPDERIWPYTNSQVYPWLCTLCESLGLQGMGMHALRRTNATLHAEAGQDPDVIRKKLGHTSFRVTEGHYIKPGTLEDLNTMRVKNILELHSPNHPNRNKNG